MANRIGPELLSDQELVSETRALVKKNNESEADIIAHLAEVDVRGLYRDYACSSLFDFCLRELGLSESVASNRIMVARRSRQFPRMLVLLREGKTHVAGLRLLVPHLTEKNCEALLEEATRKSKRQIEEMVARLSPRPAVADAIRKLPMRQVEPEPTRPEASVAAATPQVTSTPPVSRAAEPAVGVSAESPKPLVLGPPEPARRAAVEPLCEELFKVQFTANRELRDKLREAQALLRHSIPDGNLAAVFDKALTLLIRETKRDRFGLGKKARRAPAKKPGSRPSRHVPDAIKREVYERDGGQCSFVDERGQRCQERGFLELDHVQGWARRAEHSVAQIRLRCRSHNQLAAERMYGRELMRRKRTERPATPDSNGNG